MQNLAGVAAADANQIVQRELEAAGIGEVQVNPGNAEVQSTLGGLLWVGGYEIRLERQWAYWNVWLHRTPGQAEDREPHLPAPVAIALNDAPYTGPRTHYSGASATLGSVIRANGYAGGRLSANLADGVSHWHIDTQEGLNAFAQWCRAKLA